MMHLLSLVIGRFIPQAHAVALQRRGAGAAGVDAMWNMICSVFLQYCNMRPLDAVMFFTQRIVDFIFPLVGIAAVCIIIYAGIRLTISQGNDEGKTEAKKIISHALAGVVLAMIAGGVIKFFGEVFFPTLLD